MISREKISALFSRFATAAKKILRAIIPTLKSWVAKSWAFVRTRRGQWTVVACTLFLWYLFCLPGKLFNAPTSTVLLDKNGRLLGARIADDGQWRFPQLKTVPDKFARALVQYEDQYFFSHPGVNVLALGRAVKQNIGGGHVVSGGSTLTMQVIRLARNNPPRNLWQKAIEVILATRLELTYSKSEILALYASNAPFGSNVVGLDAASWRYFGRRPDQLSWAEAATLAVLPNSPALIFPGKNQLRLKTKRDQLLDQLFASGDIDAETCRLSKLEPLPGKPYALPRLAPHLLDRVAKEGYDGQFVTSTVDGTMQERVTDILERHHRSLAANQIQNAAALVLDVPTGNVIAYVGNTGLRDNTSLMAAAESGRDVDCITAPRSTGSILKPFLYAGMLNDGEILPRTLIPDIPTDIAGYQPQNFNRTYDGAVPAARALARSLNVPAVRLLQQYRTERFHGLLKKIGLTTLNQPPDHYGLSLILGGAEGKLWDIAGAYAGMARALTRWNKTHQYDNRDYHTPNFIASTKEENGTPTGPAIYDAASIWCTFEAMVDASRPDEESSWALYTSSNKIAWKTGTSFGLRDGWAIGVTPKNVVAVWVGNADGEGRAGLTGISTAAPIMFDIFSLLRSPEWFAMPQGEMQRIEVCHESGFRATEYCNKEMQWVPKAGLKTGPCTFHKLIHLDAGGQFRVTSDCADVSTMQHRNWFILPPAQEYYYRLKNPSYALLPPMKEGCGGSTEKTMEFVYPHGETKIYVPVELDGKPGRVVFEVAHRRPGAVLYWHLDSQYLGSTKSFHQMALNPEPGPHTLLVEDENGETISTTIEIVSKGGNDAPE